MPRNSSGVYTPFSGYRAEPGEVIRSAQFNGTVEDMAQALTQSVNTSGTAPMAGNLAMGNNRITGLAAATAASDAPRLDQVTKYNAFLNAIANLTMAANEIVYATGAATAAKTALTAFGRTLIGAADAIAARQALGLGSVATENTVPVNKGGTGATTAANARTSLGLAAGATMSIASQAQAQAGTDNSVVMTPVRVSQFNTANNIGYGQSWQDVTSSRSSGTTYTNNTGRPIMVNIWSRGGNIQVSTNGTTWVTVAEFGSPSDGEAGSAIVPPSHRYRGTSLDSHIWTELR